LKRQPVVEENHVGASIAARLSNTSPSPAAKKLVDGDAAAAGSFRRNIDAAVAPMEDLEQAQPAAPAAPKRAPKTRAKSQAACDRPTARV
jgi:hypothetical protein